MIDLTGATASTIIKSTKTAKIREERLDGYTYRIEYPHARHAYYVTVTHANGIPKEIFVNSQNTDDAAWISALSRLVSINLRSGVPVEVVAEELISTVDPKGGWFSEGKYYNSLLSKIGDILLGMKGVGKCESCADG
ncbi:hypothetical protein UFOVP81_5 [uncultured Caudovirales phage]|uniref:ribonucleoside-diphosphate reductase n=1 Tax=uncultured Caudovirales phage TaxID=2100421 RepID=A0A6J5KVY3_9CAUD|nr:hypothetical protein UFOVP81_5 [uncultured Caudovirales phage]